MVIDTSALIAILRQEKDADVFLNALHTAQRRRMSAASYLEAAVVTDCSGDAVAAGEFDRFIRRAEIEIEPLTFEQAQIARRAYRDFGRGRHRAGLNFGDCLAYALAKCVDEPLLFKGSDFDRTDIESALG